MNLLACVKQDLFFKLSQTGIAVLADLVENLVDLFLVLIELGVAGLSRRAILRLGELRILHRRPRIGLVRLPVRIVKLEGFPRGDQSVDDASRIEDHPESADDCAAEVRDMRDVVGAAYSLPQFHKDPERDHVFRFNGNGRKKQKHIPVREKHHHRSISNTGKATCLFRPELRKNSE